MRPDKADPDGIVILSFDVRPFLGNHPPDFNNTGSSNQVMVSAADTGRSCPTLIQMPLVDFREAYIHSIRGRGTMNDKFGNGSHESSFLRQAKVILQDRFDDRRVFTEVRDILLQFLIVIYLLSLVFGD